MHEYREVSVLRASVGILCGGKSRRMGRDKAELMWQGSSLLDRVVREMENSGRELLISAANDAQRKMEWDMPDCTHVRIVPDVKQDCGPLGGIFSVLKAAHSDAVFFCAVDMPFVTEETAAYLEQFLSSDCDGVVLADGERVHPLCGIYRKSVLPLIEAQLNSGDYRVGRLLDSCRIRQVQLRLSTLSSRTLWNLNTPEDYARAVRPLVFCVSGVKNSGKTTLVEKLVQHFLPEFPSIGVIKHDGHDFSMDQEGTDSFRAAAAGARKTAVVSRNHLALLETFRAEPSAAEQNTDTSIAYLLAQMQDMDMVILEGMKHSGYPKVELVRSGNSDSCVCGRKGLIAVASDLEQPGGVPEGVPVVELNDTAAIAGAILRYFGLKAW